jgi:hypothetical protein
MPGSPWGDPQAASGFMTGEYVGAILLVTPVEYLPNVTTQFGDKDAVTCNITVCYHPTDSSKNGEEYANARIFNAAIVGSLRSGIGKSVGGRITLGTSKMGGQKFTLDPVTDDNSSAYLNHYWPQHCDSFGVDKETGELIAKPQPAAPQQAPQTPPSPPSSAPSPSPAAAPPPPPPPPSGGPQTPPF